jgi:quercetin dioxygenase-like cupin family protein
MMCVEFEAGLIPGRCEMAREIEVDSNRVEWVPTHLEGISRKVLRNDPHTGARAVLLKFGANTHLPRHMHPAGEEVFVLEGRVRFEDSWYEAGYYLYSPPGSMDDVYSDTGAMLFVSLPKPHVDM